MSYYKSFDRDPSLPDPGSSPLGPRLITRADHDRIVASTDVHALAMLRGYLASYMGVLGLLTAGLVGMGVAAWWGRPMWVAVAAGASLVSAGSVIQTRRRATQWRSIVQARIDELLAAQVRR